MADDRQQVRQERVRRSRRNSPQVTTTSDNGQSYTDSQRQITEIDDVIHTMLNPPPGEKSVVMGEQDEQDVRLNSERLVSSFRQQGGE